MFEKLSNYLHGQTNLLMICAWKTNAIEQGDSSQTVGKKVKLIPTAQPLNQKSQFSGRVLGSNNTAL